jgi:hypothetical protein
VKTAQLLPHPAAQAGSRRAHRLHSINLVEVGQIAHGILEMAGHDEPSQTARPPQTRGSAARVGICDRSQAFAWKGKGFARDVLSCHDIAGNVPPTRREGTAPA